MKLSMRTQEKELIVYMCNFLIDVLLFSSGMLVHLRWFSFPLLQRRQSGGAFRRGAGHRLGTPAEARRWHSRPAAEISAAQAPFAGTIIVVVIISGWETNTRHICPWSSEGG
jgi:hypothetical protein